MDESEKEDDEVLITIKSSGKEMILYTKFDKYKTLQILDQFSGSILKKIEGDISNNFLKMTGHENVVKILGTQDVKTGEILNQR